jgi:hypothetical protein
VEQIAEKRSEARQAKLEQFYDDSLVQELIKEDFFKSLWGKELQSQTSPLGEQSISIHEAVAAHIEFPLHADFEMGRALRYCK